jgi:flagellar protein FlgJ
MSQTEDRQQRLQQIAKIAVALEAQTGCPAALMVAQWALESKWGEKPVGQFNCFGMKQADRHAKFCTVRTQEIIQGKPVVLDLEFADYDSVEASCRDYASLITHGAPYHTAWEQYQRDGDLHALIGAVAGKYSTSPQYAALVTAIAGQKNVLQAIADVRQEGSNATA